MGNDVQIDQKNLSEISRQTKFTEQEVRDWYIQFRRTAVDGQCTYQQFKSLFTTMYPSYDIQGVDKLTVLVFKTFDRDQSGKIDFKEFITSLGG